MHNVVSLDKADGQTIHGLAESAVNNGIPMAEANPFEPGSTRYLDFERQYLELTRSRELAVADG